MSNGANGPVPELLPQDVIERAERLEPALLSDGMKGTDIPGEGTMEAAIMPVNPGMRVVGTAITVDTCNGDNFPIHLATYTTPPGYVMVINGNQFTGKAYLGDLIVGAAQAVGFLGIVIDGYVRDRLNVPIHCGGVHVEPGDLIVGGADGVSVVPRGRVYEILDRAEEKQRMDLAMQAKIDAYNEAVARGMEPPDLMPDWIRERIQ